MRENRKETTSIRYALFPTKQLRTKGTASEAAEKPEFFEGDGLQPVRIYFGLNVASATKGTTLSKQRLFPQPLQPCPKRRVDEGFSPGAKARTKTQVTFGPVLSCRKSI